MEARIKKVFPHLIIERQRSDIYISDYTKQTQSKKAVDITRSKPNDIRSFLVRNNDSVAFSSVKFDNKSFVDKITGNSLKQCECLCFSSAQYAKGKGPWVLLLEMKYSDPNSKYIERDMSKAKGQIIATYEYYRREGLILDRQLCYLIISFPFFPSPFPHFTTLPAEAAVNRKKGFIFKCVNELRIKDEYTLIV